jgi:hypothetical protein
MTMAALFRSRRRGSRDCRRKLSGLFRCHGHHAYSGGSGRTDCCRNAQSASSPYYPRPAKTSLQIGHIAGHRRSQPLCWRSAPGRYVPGWRPGLPLGTAPSSSDCYCYCSATSERSPRDSGKHLQESLHPRLQLAHVTGGVIGVDAQEGVTGFARRALE